MSSAENPSRRNRARKIIKSMMSRDTQRQTVSEELQKAEAAVDNAYTGFSGRLETDADEVKMLEVINAELKLFAAKGKIKIQERWAGAAQFRTDRHGLRKARKFLINRAIYWGGEMAVRKITGDSEEIDEARIRAKACRTASHAAGSRLKA